MIESEKHKLYYNTVSKISLNPRFTRAEKELLTILCTLCFQKGKLDYNNAILFCSLNTLQDYTSFTYASILNNLKKLRDHPDSLITYIDMHKKASFEKSVIVLNTLFGIPDNYRRNLNPNTVDNKKITDIWRKL